MKKEYKVLIVLVSIVLLFTGCSSQESKYNTGLEAMKNEEWDVAIDCFSNIEYEDSKDLLNACIKEKGMHDKLDYAFLEDMSKSIMKRYETSEKTDNIEKCVAIELEIISKYKDAEFYDKELQKLAVAYIDGVEIEKQSLSEADGCKQLKYYEGHAKRFETLKALTDKYGLLEDNVDYKVNYYNKADDEIKSYAAIKEIESDLSKQMGDNMQCDWVEGSTYRVQIKNNTKYDYEMLMHFTFKDSKGTIVYTNDVYYEDIKAGKKYNLDFYFPENAESFDYYTEEYIK